MIGETFAFLALAIGFFFFLYAIRYYLSVLLVLAPWIGKGAKEFYPQGNNSNNREDPNGFSHRFANNNRLNNSPQANGGIPIDYEGDEAPFVSIHLPFYNEMNVANRILAACTSLDYPNYEVVVVDDSTDETVEILKRWAPHPRVKVIHREERTGFKGGALNAALDNTNPDARFVVIFDADFVPPSDILQRFLYYFNGNGGEQDRIAAVQGYQWHVLNNKETWLTRGIRAEYSGSYLVERTFQQYLGSMKMVAGSVYMIRADLLRMYRWSESITEDWELTLRLYEGGHKVRYTPYVATPAECPSSLPRLIRQRMRWAEGHTFNVKKHFWRVMRSSALSLGEKLEFLYYTPYYLQSVLLILGTGFWAASELMNAHLPWWTATLGWALLLSNLFALPLMNLTGLFLEMKARQDVSGSLIMIPLTFLVAPFQAYACLKGLFERREGGWHRTLKTGKITEKLLALKLRKRMEKFFARSRLNRRGGRRKKPEPKEKPKAGPGRRGTKPVLLLIVALTSAILLVSVLGTTIGQAQLVPYPLYLHQAAPPPPSVSPVGKLMDNISTTVEYFAVFNGSDPSTWLRYWYTEVYPTGQDPAVIAAGQYTFYMYLAPPVNTSWVTWIQVEVGYCDPDGSGYVMLLQTSPYLVFHSIPHTQPIVINLGSAPRLEFTASSPKRLRLLLEYVVCRPLNMSYNNVPYKPTRLEVPLLKVPENAFILLFIAPVIPAAIHKLRVSRKRRNMLLKTEL